MLAVCLEGGSDVYLVATTGLYGCGRHERYHGPVGGRHGAPGAEEYVTQTVLAGTLPAAGAMIDCGIVF